MKVPRAKITGNKKGWNMSKGPKRKNEERKRLCRKSPNDIGRLVGSYVGSKVGS